MVRRCFGVRFLGTENRSHVRQHHGDAVLGYFGKKKGPVIQTRFVYILGWQRGWLENCPHVKNVSPMQSVYRSIFIDSNLCEYRTSWHNRA